MRLRLTTEDCATFTFDFILITLITFIILIFRSADLSRLANHRDDIRILPRCIGGRPSSLGRRPLFGNLEAQKTLHTSRCRLRQYVLLVEQFHLLSCHQHYVS